MKEKITIGIDIGGTNTELAWVKSNGSIIQHIKFKTKEYHQPNQLVEAVGNTIINENNNLNEYNILGIGIGAPNGNFFNGTIEFAPNLGWEGVIPLAKMFEDKTDLKAKLTNDANAAAYAEMIYGGAKEMQNFLVITLGTGLGSGIVVNGQILYGATGFAGELGHTIVENNGRQCACGRKGCLETYASATGIKKTINDFLSQTKIESILRNLDYISGKDIYIAAEKGDECAIKAIEYTGQILGLHLSDYIALFSPEAIFITGGLANAHSLLIPAIEKSINENCLKIFKDSVKIYPSKLLKQNSGILGAAALITE